MHPNDAAGLMAMMMPFVLALGQHARRKRNVLLTILIAIAICVVMFGFWLTSSRGAWIALGAFFLGWVFWKTSEFAAARLKMTRPQLFASAMSLIIIVSFTILTVHFGSLEFPPSTGEVASLDSRLRLVRDTVLLIEDFPFTGGGLRSFPGLYSQYILVVPFYNTVYSHNTFLDATLEQGVMGGVSLLAIFIMTGVLLIQHLRREAKKDEQSDVWAMALLGGLGIALIHGLVDDVLYGNRGTPLLFLFPGLAMALVYPGTNARTLNGTIAHSLERIKGISWLRRIPALAGRALLAFGLFLWLRKPLLGTWHANMGAVGLARNELATWPTDEWTVVTAETELDSPETRFQRALIYRPEQRTARHRLGLMAMMHQDFAKAIHHLEQAHIGATDHHGIKKNLAFSYVWQGEFESALALFADVPEAMDELGVYVWWWETQGRSDLSINAEHMLMMLNNAG